MKIREVMTKNPAVCTPDAKLDDVVKLMIERDCGEIPILAGTQIVGVITDRDIACRGFAQGKNPLDIPVREIMTKPVFTISENDELDTALLRMREHHVRRLPVVRDSKLTGIISVADLIADLPNNKIAQLVSAVSKPIIEVAVPAP